MPVEVDTAREPPPEPTEGEPASSFVVYLPGTFSFYRQLMVL